MKNKKKNVTPLTVICDHNKLPLSVKCIDQNKIIYNGRKTAKHEIKNVQNTLDNMTKLQIKDYIKVQLIGDKGYITKEQFTVLNRKLDIITPKRKNQKKRNTRPSRSDGRLFR